MHACVENIPDPEAVHTAISSAPLNSSDANPAEQQPADQPPIQPQDFRPENSKPQNAEPQETSAGLARWFGFAKSRSHKIPNIVHVDVHAFFASVEQVLNPQLRGKPVLVGCGVVASASYEAKSRGVKTAMTFREALRLCPKAIIVPGQYDQYADFAERVRRILESYTPAVETAALDDFYLDFAGTGMLSANFEATLRRMQSEILGRTGLNVSIGAGSSKLVASIASRLQRPRGVHLVPCGEEEAFLAPLPIENINGTGQAYGATLAERGIATIGELRQVPKAALQSVFGKIIGRQIWDRARGRDGREVRPPSMPKSIWRETAIAGGTLDNELLGGLIEYLSERIGSTLREQGNRAHTVELHVSYIDHFSVHQAVRLPRATADEREILAAARDLFAKLFSRRIPLQWIGMDAAYFAAGKCHPKLLVGNATRRWYLNLAVDSLRERNKMKQNALLPSTPCLSR